MGLKADMEKRTAEAIEEVTNVLSRFSEIGLSDLTEDDWDTLSRDMDVHLYIERKDGATVFEVRWGDNDADVRYFPILDVAKMISDGYEMPRSWFSAIAEDLEEAARRIRGAKYVTPET